MADIEENPNQTAALVLDVCDPEYGLKSNLDNKLFIFEGFEQWKSLDLRQRARGKKRYSAGNRREKEEEFGGGRRGAVAGKKMEARSDWGERRGSARD
ncbi:hypothetical protein Drorol1_Dr00024982 [Drosera rotundifolia]